MEQSARIGIATADLYPSFSLVGTLGVGGATANNANSGVSLFYSFGPRITLPFLDYGRTRNRIRTEDARFEQAVVSYQQTVLVAAQEVEDGMHSSLGAYTKGLSPALMMGDILFLAACIPVFLAVSYVGLRKQEK